MSKVHWIIPCPICGKRLRVLDQSLLGRRGQCPVCRHKFALEVPKSPEFVIKHADSGLDFETTPTEETLKFDSDFKLPAEDDDTHPT